MFPYMLAAGILNKQGKERFIKPINA